MIWISVRRIRRATPLLQPLNGRFRENAGEFVQGSLAPLLGLVIAHIVQGALEGGIRIFLAESGLKFVKGIRLPRLLVVLQPQQFPIGREGLVLLSSF